MVDHNRISKVTPLLPLLRLDLQAHHPEITFQTWLARIKKTTSREAAQTGLMITVTCISFVTSRRMPPKKHYVVRIITWDGKYIVNR